MYTCTCIYVCRDEEKGEGVIGCSTQNKCTVMCVHVQCIYVHVPRVWCVVYYS